MKTFEEKIKQIKRTRIVLASLILLMALILFIWAIIEIIPKKIEYVEFDRDNKISNYVRTTIYYLTGPIIEATNTKTGELSKYYVANGVNDEIFIIRTGEETELPIYGKDITEENINSLQGIEVYGVSQLTSGSLTEALNIGLNKIFNEEIANSNNFHKVLGGYHIDTIGKPTNIAVNLFLVGLFLAVIGCLYLVINRRIRKNIENTINELTEKGKLEEVIKEYEGGKRIDYKNIKVSLSPQYLFSYTNGIYVIAISNIKEVSISKRNFVDRKKYKYIIVETKNNEKYGIAPFKKKAEKKVANELLMKIKSMIR